MDDKTYVVAMGEGGCVNRDIGCLDYGKSIQFCNYEGLTILEGHPNLYTAKDLAKARAEGQAEAWELARKMVLPASYGGYSTHEQEAIFGTCELVKAFDYCPSYADAQAKVIAYEEAFHVGDVVVNKFGSKAVITCVARDDSFYIMYKDGSGSIQNKKTWWGDPSPVDLGWKKTGKTIDVSGITDKLKEYT